MTPASSPWTQLWTPTGFALQSNRLDSLPVQARLSRRMGPVPCP